MFCPSCGEKNPDGAKFCAKCGASLAPAAGSTAAPAQQAAPAAAPALRRRHVPIVAIIVAVVAVLGAIGAGVWFAFFSPWPIDENSFPDPALRAVVAATADTDHNGELSRDEGRALTALSVEGATSIEGLGGYFPNLAQLTVTGGALTSLDVSDLPALASLDAASEPLPSLDVSANPELSALRVPDSTQVTGLDATTLHESWVVSSVEERYDTGYATTYSVERDAQGRVTGRRVTDGEEESWWSYDYDDQGRLASETESMAYDDGDESVTTYGYDDAGNLTSVESYDGVFAYYYAYDDQGRLSTMDMGGVNDPTSRTTYVYDEAGHLGSSTYRYKSQTGMRTDFSYDDQGNLVSAAEFDETLGEPYQTVAYQRDARGNVTRVTYDVAPSYQDGNWSPVDFGYDDAGRVVSARATLYGSTYSASVTYDERGNVAQVTDGVEGGRTTTFTPSYTRFFVAEDGREPDSGIAVNVEYVPLIGAQRTSLVNVWATPAVLPDPNPMAQPGESMVLLY